MKKIYRLLALTIALLIGLNFHSFAQSDKELLEDLIAEEQDAVNALVLYPSETRLAIFNSTLHPEALIKMESIQSRTSTAFQEMMQSHPQSSQEIIWDLTRYPGLIHQLALYRTKQKTSLQNILSAYPEVIHRRAKEAVDNHDLPLVAVDQLNHAAESAFNNVLDEYPPEIQQSLQELIELPEVLSLLTEHIRLTILVGHVYQQDPQWVIQKADSAHLEVARQNAEELSDWKASLENNPEALEELNASMEAYQDEYNYDDDYYDYEYYDDDSYDEVIIRHHYYSYHYPYWFGYPSWYAYPRWRHYPSWYDWGFYYYPNRPIIIIGLPSFHFNHWFFHHPHHHYHYPHLSAHYVSHYNGHRRSGSSVTTTVGNWRHRNNDVISDKWMKDDGKLANRFKEYGEFETSREKHNKVSPQKSVSKKEYLNRNQSKYPGLDKSVKDKKVQKADQKKAKWDTAPKPKIKDKTKPKVKKTDKRKPDYKVTKPKPSKKKDTRIIKPKTKTRKAPKIKKGKNYHKNVWEKSKTRRTKPPKTNRTKTTRPKVKRKKPGGN